MNNEIPKDKEIAEILGLTERSVFNKRTGRTEWKFSEYLKLIAKYGTEKADIITKKEEVKENG